MPLLIAAELAVATAKAQALDTAKLGETRSAVAEAAAVIRAQAKGQVTDVYAEGLYGDIRKDLQALESEPALRELVRAALQALEARDAAALSTLKDRITALERSHGRAG